MTGRPMGRASGCGRPGKTVERQSLPYDPDDYARLLQPIVDGKADVVFGSCLSRRKRRVRCFRHQPAVACSR
jgi:hypothetical protein